MPEMTAERSGRRIDMCAPPGRCTRLGRTPNRSGKYFYSLDTPSHLIVHVAKCNPLVFAGHTPISSLQSSGLLAMKLRIRISSTQVAGVKKGDRHGEKWKHGHSPFPGEDGWGRCASSVIVYSIHNKLKFLNHQRSRKEGELEVRMCQSCGCTPCKTCGKEIKNGVCTGCGKPSEKCTCTKGK
jgi:hypothetical protein